MVSTCTSNDDDGRNTVVVLIRTKNKIRIINDICTEFITLLNVLGCVQHLKHLKQICQISVKSMKNRFMTNAVVLIVVLEMASLSVAAH